MESTQWRSYFRDRGIPNELTKSYVSYAGSLQKKNLPVIFEFEHLSLLLGLNIEPLARMIASPSSFYREFAIPKRSGGKRNICAPHESLLLAQRWILKNILEKSEVHVAAQGFLPGRSIKSNALIHLNSKNLLKMDLRDFFPSIPMSWVINVFKDCGYAPNVAYYLASLCCHSEALAQGAATSPALSNIILKSFDKRLTRLANKCGLKYSRYADDLTFSGETIHHSFSGAVEKITAEYGLAVNKEKTRLKIGHGARVVTGISIQGGRLAVPSKFKRELQNEVFFIRKFGLLSHLSNRKISNPNYLNSLLGRVSFWLHIEPENEKAQLARKLIMDTMKI
ncbi:reverse transcriptase domain-containing protein [Massilia sp. ZL223]|uniref:reverse transcriptase domain-containing protein n=1 Tax=Massilia sp. ZL223 TaxID=2824904 RepID=UPI001B844325|nr:reverse transcriptase domain-containing protein [Massilia sp. ZL223]MBQ5964296.1 RNA-directed DNA polymerase [Massilia sp. ZL223]